MLKMNARGQKKFANRIAWTGIIVGVGLTSALAQRRGTPQPRHLAPQPLTFALDCAGGDCPLLKGVPQTLGTRSGQVRLKPGESIGWHTTVRSEEILVILQGKGSAQIEGRADIPVSARMLAYIPPQTKHNVTNNSDDILEYVWIAAPASGTP